MQNNNKNYIIFGPRVTKESREEILKNFKGEKIDVSFGPFNSGAVHCELFPFLRDERELTSHADAQKRYQENLAKLRHAKVTIVESTGEQPDIVSDSIERVRSTITTLKDHGVKEVTVAMPNCAYDRQDRPFSEQGRICSVNAKRFARDLRADGADKIITIEPHSEGTVKFWKDEFGENYNYLSSTELFAQDIKTRFPNLNNMVIGAPDGADKPNDRGQIRARKLAAAVQDTSEEAADVHLFKIAKEHKSANETFVAGFEGDVADKDCVIIDDMSDGGGTLINAAKALKERGAKSVATYFTHAICIGKDGKSALENLLEPQFAGKNLIDQVVCTDSVFEIEQKRKELNSPELKERVAILSTGKLIAQELTRQQKIPLALTKPSPFANRVASWQRADIAI